MLPQPRLLPILAACGITIILFCLSTAAGQVELARLNADNWQTFQVAGKEADAIYGDWVLRNPSITLVIAETSPTRNANMTVRRVGGCLIDLGRRDRPNDQLSCFYPLASRYSFEDLDNVQVSIDGSAVNDPQQKTLQGESIEVVLSSKKQTDGSYAELTYRLRQDQPFVEIETRVQASPERPTTLPLRDAMRADRTFQFGTVEDTKLFWAYDEWFSAAYGVQSDELPLQRGKGNVVIEYLQNGTPEVTLAPGESFSWKRRVFPGPHQLNVQQQARKYNNVPDTPVRIVVKDPSGPVRQARVTLFRDDVEVGVARTNNRGVVTTRLVEGDFELSIAGMGRPESRSSLRVGKEKVTQEVRLDACGYAVARVTDGDGQPIPCKVSFYGVEETADPFFGPDSKPAAVHNTRYSANGQFRQAIAPGNYDVVVSRGPEYDAFVQRVTIERGQETMIEAALNHSVDSAGWVSGEFHSHSTPSGDNTSSQRGRVLNLLAEQIEFAPCTEHNRIDTYKPHLDQLRAHRWMATCTGMELTGGPLPLNHQNAFPLIRKPHRQDGGGPVTDVNPVVQIERLAMWDSGSSKLVQTNHPNLIQMFGDANLDREPDGGFRDMFQYMDVVEVHPPASILERPTDYPKADDRGNTIFVWLQLLNQGIRVPGVVNTDAHYNFHGSGWLRNYIRSSTDDPRNISTEEMVTSSERGHIVMTTGPFMEVNLRDAAQPNDDGGPGDDVRLTTDAAQLHVRVQCANWLDINRVQVLINGDLIDDLNFTRRDHPELFANGVVKFDQTIDLELPTDAHVIVVAAGEGLKLGRVMGPQWGEQMPIAVSNPIFVDRDGDGFQANGDLLGAPLPIGAASQ